MSNSIPVSNSPRQSVGLGTLFSLPARLILWLLGWKIVGQPPDLPKYVIIGAHHTSNSDGFLMLLYAMAIQLKINFLMKDSWFRGPLGLIARTFGGISIDRSQRHNTVKQIADAFHARDRMVLVITPEGTRKYVPHWRSGFYHIAQQARVPLALGFADYKNKKVGFGPLIMPTGDIEADMAKIREFYSGVTGRYPEKAGAILLKPQEQPAETAR